MIIGALSLLMIAISVTINSISNKAVNNIIIKENAEIAEVYETWDGNQFTSDDLENYIYKDGQYYPDTDEGQKNIPVKNLKSNNAVIDSTYFDDYNE